MVDLERTKNYCHIDYCDDDDLLNMLIVATDIYIENCVGSYYKTNDKLVKLADLLQLKLIDSCYENRTTTVDVDKQDRRVTTILEILSDAGDYSE